MIGTFPGHPRYEFDPEAPFLNMSEEYKGVRLLKLHGSLSWAHLVLEKDDFRQRMTGRGFGGVYVVNSRNILWNLPRWLDRGNLITLAPAIIPPMSGKKQILEMDAFAGVWKEAETRLNEATRITIAGYSFPPTDVEACSLLRDNTANLHFINVLNPDESVCKRVEEIYAREVSEHFHSITGYLRRFSQRL